MLSTQSSDLATLNVTEGCRVKIAIVNRFSDHDNVASSVGQKWTLEIYDQIYIANIIDSNEYYSSTIGYL